MLFSETIKTLRLEKNLSQKDVASAIGVDRTTYSKYETGKSLPDLNMLQKIADLHSVSVDYLLGRTNIRSLEQCRSIQAYLSQQDIAMELERLVGMSNTDGLLFYGQAVSDADKEIIKEIITSGLKIIKLHMGVGGEK